MCRIFGYLGQSIHLDRLLEKPEHSLIVQSYQPKELRQALLNADGFGLGWYHLSDRHAPPYLYKNTLPIWNDINLPHLCRFIETRCTVANVRSATPGLAVDLSNCHPFNRERLLFVHNGYIENFRQTLFRPMRNLLSDTAYQSIHGTTDSEHVFALFCDRLDRSPSSCMVTALAETLDIVADLAKQAGGVPIHLNLMLADGDTMVASRFSNESHSPSLYWLRDDPVWPGAVAIASEPMFAADWISFDEASIICVGANLDVQIQRL